MTEPLNSDQPADPPVSHWLPPEPKETTIRPPRSARLRSRFAIGLLAICGVLGVIAGFQDVGGLGLADRAEAGVLTVEEANAFDLSVARTGLFQLGAYILTAIAYLAWLSRSVDNVPGLGGGTPTVTPGWSIAWWFIPIANLFKPYQVVADLYRRMSPFEKTGVGLVLAWWLVWIVNNLIGQGAGRVINGDSIESFRLGLQLYAVTDFGDLLAAALAIAVILRIQRWADAREAGQLTSPDSEPEPEPVPAS